MDSIGYFSSEELSRGTQLRPSLHQAAPESNTSNQEKICKGTLFPETRCSWHFKGHQINFLASGGPIFFEDSCQK
jgi:hypothetical protein